MSSSGVAAVMISVRASVFRRVSEDISSTHYLTNRFTLQTQQRCGFRKITKRVEPKKGVAEEAELNEILHKKGEAPAPDPPTPHVPARSFGRLVKPLVFTIGFTGCSFGGAAIWQYESLKSRVQSYFDDVKADWLEKIRPQKQGDLHKQVSKWWNSLSDGQKTVTGIIAANALVFFCWRVPSLQHTMFKYFTSNPSSKALCWPMLLSTFSHYSLFHMAANMYVLWSFSSSIVNMMGKEQFMALYLSAGVISTFVSYVSKTAMGRFGPSLGASGAIMTVLCVELLFSNDGHILMIFSCQQALKALVALDTTGLILGWRFFDHAAHLGGALFGIWYIIYGHELIWKNREPLVKLWHDFRTRGPGAGGTGSI
ncbi:presenilins-associated rhomboid-like protein, mitochondrial [Sinocyclocheilus rhinocerous]|uniref:presenilins-associated rhomboid-like protein, mitochondrial n=1 Tax=Sinocyclocheilus rhinocerous TaxID=307959 RepID=UPI0007BA86CA|nr:PREDICTED: presenilins-associated rhomboid-like protein, mitochondrial [Sinocyclocheilus rhinocerous]